MAEVTPWSRTFGMEKQRQELCDFDGEQMDPYFAVDRVLKGMFRIVAELYQIEICEARTHCGEGAGTVEAWHPDVRFFTIVDKASGKHLGSFFADLYPREIKHPGAWMDTLELGRGGEPHIGYL